MSTPSSAAGRPMSQQRKKISTACYACRKRKSKCEGSFPTCLTCQAHGTVCLYNFDADARKTPSKAYINALKTRIKTLEDLLDQLLDESDLNVRETIIQQIRQQRGRQAKPQGAVASPAQDAESQSYASMEPGEDSDVLRDMTNLMAHLHVDKKGAISAVGPTSNLMSTLLPRIPPICGSNDPNAVSPSSSSDLSTWPKTPYTDELSVVVLTPLERHLIQLYFTWQHPSFHLFSRDRFLRDLENSGGPCFSPMLLAAVLSVGCQFSDLVDERQGDVYFVRAKKLLEQEIERPSLTTCQALVLMGIREAGCGRERGSGWLYAGIGFRIGLDLGIHIDSRQLHELGYLSDEDVQERALTFWGSFVSDKGWTAYLGRPESFPHSNVEEEVRLPDPNPQAELRPWVSYTDNNVESPAAPELNVTTAHELGVFKQLCLLVSRQASVVRNVYTKKRIAAEMDIVSDLHTKLLEWDNTLPQYARLSPTAPPMVLHIHMYYHTTLILLFRPFIRSRRHQNFASSGSISGEDTPLTTCTTSALAITRCIKQYKNRFTLRRYVNTLVHAIFTAATIHVINVATTKPRQGSNLQDAGICTHEEAVKKLQETMQALAEMGVAWKSAHSCLDTIHEWIIKYNLDALVEETDIGGFAFDAQAKQNDLVVEQQPAPIGYCDPAVLSGHLHGHGLPEGHGLDVSEMDPTSIEGDNEFWGNLNCFDQLYWSGNLILDQPECSPLASGGHV